MYLMLCCVLMFANKGSNASPPPPPLPAQVPFPLHPSSAPAPHHTGVAQGWPKARGEPGQVVEQLPRGLGRGQSPGWQRAQDPACHSGSTALAGEGPGLSPSPTPLLPAPHRPLQPAGTSEPRDRLCCDSSAASIPTPPLQQGLGVLEPEARGPVFVHTQTHAPNGAHRSSGWPWPLSAGMGQMVWTPSKGCKVASVVGLLLQRQHPAQGLGGVPAVLQGPPPSLLTLPSPCRCARRTWGATPHPWISPKP